MILIFTLQDNIKLTEHLRDLETNAPRIRSRSPDKYDAHRSRSMEKFDGRLIVCLMALLGLAFACV